MTITYDEIKRSKTLRERGLDFQDSHLVFTSEQPIITVLDDRNDYGEERWQTMGMLHDDLVMIVWTPRAEARRIISMRKCNDREKGYYHVTVDGSG